MSDFNELVESTITQIFFDLQKKEVQIEVQCAGDNKQLKRIVFSGVVDMFINEARFSNIVDRVNIFDSSSVENNKIELLENLFFLMRGKMPSLTDLEWPQLTSTCAKISNGDLSLIEIEPVHGASALILASNFRLE